MASALTFGPSAAWRAWAGAQASSQQPAAQHDGNAYSPRMAFDLQGNAMALWHQADGARHTIWARPYSASLGWGRTMVEPKFAAQDVDSAPLAQFALGSDVTAWQNITTTSHK